MTTSEKPERAGTDWEAATESPTFRIVGIGASAGGLESLERFFGACRPTPAWRSWWSSTCRPTSRLMDGAARPSQRNAGPLGDDGAQVGAEPHLPAPAGQGDDHPQRQLGYRQGPQRCRCQSTVLPLARRRRGPQAVAVVLSGSGTDGSRGVVEVKRAGGMVLAERGQRRVRRHADARGPPASSTHRCAARARRILCGLRRRGGPPEEPTRSCTTRTIRWTRCSAC